MTIEQTILVVDDEKSNVEFLVNNLQEKYNVKIAPNGDIALKILDRFNVDLILLDIDMPILDGYETLKEIKKKEKLKDIPVIFLTSKYNDDSMVYGYELGVKDYIKKPFNTKELEVRVDNHIQTYELIKKLEYAYKNLEKFIQNQESIVILTDGITIKFINKQFSDFFGYKNIADFLKDHKCICEYFVENDRFFHLGKIKDDENWVDVIEKLPESERIVSLVGKRKKEHLFAVSVSCYDRYAKLVTFTDVTESIEEKMNMEGKILHDKLTGAYNKKYFEENYKKILNDYSSLDYKLGVALLDIDRFRIINDNHGHDIGDHVLREFVQTIKNNSRQDDILIRWGGEEFVLLLKISSSNDLEKALDNLRKVIQNHNYETVGGITCSIGASVYNRGENIQLTLKRSDEAVYTAKANGRNRVVIKV